jgi:hypothetical protein
MAMETASETVSRMGGAVSAAHDPDTHKHIDRIWMRYDRMVFSVSSSRIHIGWLLNADQQAI